jgi:hypothetical protein
MSPKPDNSVTTLVPYIRLTKDQDNNYTLWVAVFIPQNYRIKEDPTVTIKNDDLVAVSISVDGPKEKPSPKWEVVPLKVKLPSPDMISEQTTIKTTVWLDDPEDEGSSEMKYGEAEDEG